MNDLGGLRSTSKTTLIPALVLSCLLLLFFRVQLRLDAHHYYEPLRSLVFDGDLNTYNEREYVTTRAWHGTGVERKPLLTKKGTILGFMSHPAFTSQGYSYLFFPMGWMCLMSPSLVAVNLAIEAASWVGLIDSYDGYNYPYLLALSLTSYCYGALGLILAYKLCLKYFPPSAALFGFCAVITVHNVLPYLAVDPLYSHAHSLFLISGYFLAWAKVREGDAKYLPIVLGLLGGLLAITRYQNLTLAAIPFMDLAYAAIRRKALKQELRVIMLFLVGMTPALTIQTAAWKLLHGVFIIDRVTMGTGEIPTFDPFHPQLAAMLFSNQQGLFSWTPFMAISVLGLIPLLLRAPRLGWYVLFQFAIQTYHNSTRSEWWNLGFGIRRYSDYAVIFMLGFAAFYALMPKRLLKGALIILLGVSGVWNLTFTAHYYDSDRLNLHGPYYEAIVGGLVPYQFFEYRVVYPPSDKLTAIIKSSAGSLFNRSEFLRLSKQMSVQPGLKPLLKLTSVLVGILLTTGFSFWLANVGRRLPTRHPIILLPALLPLGITSWLLLSGFTDRQATAIVPDRAGTSLIAHQVSLHPDSWFVGLNTGMKLDPGSSATVAWPSTEASRFQAVVLAPTITSHSMNPRLKIELLHNSTTVTEFEFSYHELLESQGQKNLVPLEPDFSSKLSALHRSFSPSVCDTLRIGNEGAGEIMLIGLAVY